MLCEAVSALSVSAVIMVPLIYDLSLIDTTVCLNLFGGTMGAFGISIISHIIMLEKRLNKLERQEEVIISMT